MKITPSRRSSLSRRRSLVPHTTEVLESRIAPASVVSFSSGSLSVQGDQGGAGQVESLVFTISGSNLHIADATHTITASGGGVTQSGANAVDIALGSLTGSLTVNTGSGLDTVQLSAALSGLTGVTVQTGSVLQDASITLGGSAPIGFTTSAGIKITSGAHLSTTDGALTLQANQQAIASTGAFAGIEINNATVESLGPGAVSLTGRGGTVGDGAVGILVTGNSLLSGGTGSALTISGTGGATAAGSADGVLLGSSQALISSHGSNVQISGLGGGIGASSDNLGVNIVNGTVSAGGSGSVTITGTGSSTSTGGSNFGVGVRFGAHVGSSGGAVSITGFGGNSAAGQNDGVILSEVALIDAAGTGAVSVTGTGGSGLSHGVSLASQVTGNAKITSNGGAVTITGTAGGAGSSAINLSSIDSIGSGGTLSLIGDSMNLNGAIGSASTTTATLRPLTSGFSVTLGSEVAGQLSLTDAELDHVTAGLLQIGGAATGTVTVAQPITQVNALAITSGSGVVVNGALSTTGSSLTITADQAAINAGVQASSVALRPLTAGRGVSLGTEIGTALSLTDAELDLVSGTSVTLGSAASGAVSVNAAISHPAGSNFTLQSGTDVTFNAGFNTGGGSLALNGNVQPVASGADVTASTTTFVAGSKLAIAINSATPDTLGVAGQINLTGSTLQLSGSYVPAAGQSFTIVSNDGGDAVVGTFNGLAEGSIIVFNGVSLALSYHGGDGNDVTVTANAAPTVTRAQAAVVGNEGDTLTNSGSFNDPDAGQTVTITTNIGTVTQTNGGSGTYTWSLPTGDNFAAQTVVITATDNFGVSSTTSFTAQANNVAPTPSITGPTTGNEGSPVSLTGSATDPAGANDPLTLTWSVTKNGNAYASGSGTAINFTPDDDGTYVATLTANDGDGGINSTTRTVTVGNVAPTLTTSGAISANEGSTYTLNLAHTDPGADTLSSWTINWGDGSAPQTVSGSATSVTHVFADNGNYNIATTATDEDGTYSANTQAVSVANVAPNLSASGAATSNEGSAYTLNLASSDPGADTISSWTINWGDGSAPQTVSGSATSVTHTFADNGNYAIAASATDEDGTYSAAPVNVAVANVAPSLLINGAASVNEGSPYSLSLSKSDPGADTISSWTINWGDGSAPQTISGSATSVAHTFADNGNYSISATATDEDGTYSANTQPVSVANVAHSVSISGSATANEGSSYTLQLADSDAGADTLSSWTINWGDGSAPQMVSGSAISVTHTFADNGSYNIAATATDEDGTYSANPVSVAVANVAPTLTASGAASGQEGSSYTLNLAKSDPGADTISSWTINWGDGSAPQTVSGSATSVTHVFVDNGNYSIATSATDEDGTYNGNSVSVAVGNVAPTLTASGAASGQEGSSYTLNLAKSDPGADTVSSWTINWGDGSAPQTVSGSATSVTHVFADNGNYSIATSATDDDGTYNGNSVSVAVGNVAPTLTTSGAATSQEGSSYTLNLAKSDPGADTISSWIINWGDGSAPQTVSGSATSVTHVFADNGNFSIAATATDEDGTYAANSTSVAVANVAPSLTLGGAASANEGSTYTLSLGKSDPGADTISLWTINWGDGSAPQTVSGSASSVTHVFADNGSYSIAATATDEDGTYAAPSKTVGIQNVAPNLFISGSSSTAQGASYSLGLSSNDPGADTISSWTINWGDGSAAQVVAGNPSAVTHVYATAGNFTISSAATDEDGTYTGNTQAVAVGGAPLSSAVQPVSAIDESSSARLNGSFTDSNVSSTHQVTIAWGDWNDSANSVFTLPATSTLNVGTTATSPDGATLTVTAVNKTTGAVSYSTTHLYKDDGPAGGNGTGFDTTSITASVKNSSNTTSSASTSVKVSNAAPELSDCGPYISGTSSSPTQRGDYTYFSGFFSDSGVLDGEKVIIDWGDGTTTDSSQGLSSGTVVATYNGVGGFVAAHKYSTGGIFDVTYRVVDDDGGSATGTAQSWVSGVRLTSTGELQIVGSSDSDSILVNYKGADGQGDSSSANSDDKTKVTVHATFENDCDPDTVINTAFTASQVKSVFISTGASSDYVHVSNNLTVATYISTGSGNDTVLGSGGADVIDGGEGDDTLSGADGNDIIIGGAGNDKLYAGTGNNVLSGGDGNDLLQGGSTRDVLIGGRGTDNLIGGNSSTDTSIGDLLIGGLAKNENNIEALRSVLSIWSSNDTYANIVTQLTKVGGLLEVGVQVFDDHATDTLTGNSKAKDLFFADLDRLHGDDDIVSGSSNDTVKALAEILAT